MFLQHINNIKMQYYEEKFIIYKIVVIMNI
jgi:hypothetical protein